MAWGGRVRVFVRGEKTIHFYRTFCFVVADFVLFPLDPTFISIGDPTFCFVVYVYRRPDTGTKAMQYGTKAMQYGERRPILGDMAWYS